VLADRALVTMTSPFMRAYSLLLIKTCHRRGAFAMGGMAAQIPIKNDPACILPDRGQVTMTTHFLRSYSQQVIKVCHRRNVHAMGGMAAQIPIRNDEAANAAAIAKVRADKEREAGDGHDGTWVAHPGLVATAKAVFDAHMTGPNQIARQRQDVDVTAKDLLAIPEGAITEQGLRTNISVGVQYLGAWLNGIGCVPINNLM